MKTLYHFLWPDGPYVGRATFVLGADEDDAYGQLTDAGAQEGASIVGGELSPVDRFMLSFCPNDIVDEDLCWEGVTWLQDEPSGHVRGERRARAVSSEVALRRGRALERLEDGVRRDRRG